MHCFAIVMIPPDGDAEEHVDRLMAPHKEDWVPDPNGAVDEDGEPEGELVGFWNWYQIGGRWKGALVSEYDSSKDPDHIETCWLCNGTGRRTDVPEADWEAYKAGPMNGCNRCKGTGRMETWPTKWAPHPRDVMPVAEYAAQFLADPWARPYRFVAEGVNLERDGMRDTTDTEMQPHDRAVFEHIKAAPDDSRVVVVDYHC